MSCPNTDISRSVTSDNSEQGFMQLRLARKVPLAQDIWLFEFENPDGGPLPSFEPGAHVTIITATGARRNYSLSGDPSESHRYQLGIKAERGGRGTSVSLIDETAEGDLFQISAPENSFRLIEADEYLFIAGGIGITPIMSMMRYLHNNGNDNFRLIYCTRSPELTAFRGELESLQLSDRIVIHHDEGSPDQIYDFWPLLETPGKKQVYCCGPRPMMEEVRDMTGHWPNSHIHFEDFASDVQPVKDDDKPFQIRHADTGEVVLVPADATILETLRANGYAVPSSCESGTCGTCRTALISGQADHRDMVLEDQQRSDFIMICVSRAVTGELVLRW